MFGQRVKDTKKVILSWGVDKNILDPGFVNIAVLK
jgi:hypothetical protein